MIKVPILKKKKSAYTAPDQEVELNICRDSEHVWSQHKLVIKMYILYTDV